jgi:hypothetical protein
VSDGSGRERVTFRRHPRLYWPLLVAAVAVYAGAYVFTVGTSGHRARPLFEGVGPAPAYRWVKPPRAFAANNVPPHPTTQSVHLGSTGSPQVGIVSGDSQLVLNLPAGAIPPAPAETSASVTIRPMDVARLGRLPGGLFPDGNAYQVSIKYDRSGRLLADLAVPGDAVVTAPAPGVTVLFSLDGASWPRLQTSLVNGGTTLAASFQQPGYFLAGATVNVVGTAGPGSSKHTPVIILAVLIAVAAALLILAPFLYFRSRRDDEA